MRWVRVLVAARALWADEWAADEDRVLWCGGEDEGGILFSRETITRGLSEACEDKGLEPCGMFHTGVYSPGPARTDVGGTSGCCSSRSPDAPSS